MKEAIISLFLIIPGIAFGQLDSAEFEKLGLFYVDFMYNEIQLYADTLNNWDKERDLPTFVFDPLFDINLVEAWPSSHTSVSFRWIILNRVTNKKVLAYIISNESPLLDQVHVPKGSIFESVKGHSPPFYTFSTRQLAELRLESLKMSKYLLKE